MSSDIKLDGDDVTVESINTYFRRQDQSSVSLNLANSTGHWHISGPRDEDDGPLAIYWFNGVTKQYEGPMFRLGQQEGISHLSIQRRDEFPTKSGRPIGPIELGGNRPKTVNLLDLLVTMSETITDLRKRVVQLENPGGLGVKVVGGSAPSGGRPPKPK